VIGDRFVLVLQAPEPDVKGVLLSEEGVAAGKAKVLHSEDELHDALAAAAAVEGADDVREDEQAAAVVS